VMIIDRAEELLLSFRWMVPHFDGCTLFAFQHRRSVFRPLVKLGVCQMISLIVTYLPFYTFPIHIAATAKTPADQVYNILFLSTRFDPH